MKKISYFLAALTLVFGAAVTALPSQVQAGGGGLGCDSSGVPSAYFNNSSLTGLAPHSVDFTSSSDGCGDQITSYSWNFGDGNTAEGENTSHTFSEGSWNVVLTITDEAGLQDSYQKAVNVRTTNEAPVANPDSYQLAFNPNDPTSWGGSVLDNDTDTDGDSLSSQLVSQAEHVEVTLGSIGYFTVNNPDKYSGSDSFSYSVDDGYGGTSTTVVQLELSEMNIGPTATDDSYTIQEDEPATLNPLANDTDPNTNDSLGVDIISYSEGVSSVSVNPDGTVTVTAAAGYNGLASISYYAYDQQGWYSNVATISLNIESVYDPVEAQADYFNVDEDAVLTGSVAGNDSADTGQTANYQVVSGPSNGQLSLNSDGSFSYTPDTNFNGSDSFTYSASDGISSSTAIANIAVASVNDAPSADFSYSVGKGGNVSFNGGLSNDIDGSIASYSWNFGDGSSATGATPSHKFKRGTYTVTLTVTDNQGAQTTIQKQLSL